MPSDKSTDLPVSEMSQEITPLVEKNEGELFKLSVGEEETSRLDAFLAGKIEGFSRSRFKDLIKEGKATVNGATNTSPNHRLKTGDEVTLALPPPEDPLPIAQDIPLDIAFEDDDLIVVNKPAGLVVHPAAGNWDGTLVNGLIYHCGDSLSGVGGVKRPGIVHRLDKDTSGLLVVAKNDHAHQGLAAQFADHGRTGPLRRAYKALLWGAVSPPSGTVDTMIGRAPKNRLKMAVLENSGRQAITHYSTDETYHSSDGTPLASLITCRLETGRTHQIRVHMTHLGAPLIGDPLYGAHFSTKVQKIEGPLRTKLGKFRRQALHAFLLAFEHPRTGEKLHFETNISDDMAAICEDFGKFYSA